VCEGEVGVWHVLLQFLQGVILWWTVQLCNVQVIMPLDIM